MLSVDQVLTAIHEKVMALQPVELPLAQAAGAVLAVDVRMREDSPPFDRAQLDGFAVRASDFSSGRLPRLRLIGQLDAGNPGKGPALEEGECLGINTGAVMPPGADAVLMVEHSERATNPGGVWIQAHKAVTSGYGVQRLGSDALAGQAVLTSGRRLGAVELAICAAAGAGQLSVRQLQAAILTTGDELVEPEATPGPGQIRNSNGPMLRALLHEQTTRVLDLGTCGDDAQRLRALLHKGLHESDLLIVSGGMSMGTKDLVPPLLKELGVVFHVEKVRIKPGKPLVIGSWARPAGGGATYVAGLPGNPVSAFVTFQRFVRPLIGQMLQSAAPAGALVEAELRSPLPENGDREFYQPCQLTRRGASLVAEALGWKGSADLFTLARADGLLVRAANAPALATGAHVSVLLLRNSP